MVTILEQIEARRSAIEMALDGPFVIELQPSVSDPVLIRDEFGSHFVPVFHDFRVELRSAD